MQHETQHGPAVQETLVAVYKLPAEVIAQFEAEFQEAYNSIKKAATSLGLTTHIDGVLIHPELGPTGFVAPADDVKSSMVETDHTINLGGEEYKVWLFKPTEEGLIEDVELFHKYMNQVAPLFANTSLPLWLSQKLGEGVEGAPAFAFVVDSSDGGVYILYSEAVPGGVGKNIEALGGQPVAVAEGTTIQQFGDQIIHANARMAGGETDAVNIGDDVDVQVISARKQ